MPIEHNYNAKLIPTLGTQYWCLDLELNIERFLCFADFIRFLISGTLGQIFVDTGGGSSLFSFWSFVLDVLLFKFSWIFSSLAHNLPTTSNFQVSSFLFVVLVLVLVFLLTICPCHFIIQNLARIFLPCLLIIYLLLEILQFPVFFLSF